MILFNTEPRLKTLRLARVNEGSHIALRATHTFIHIPYVMGHPVQYIAEL